MRRTARSGRLFGVSFTVGEGEAVALLGTNGAGKTTVARVCTGLVPPTAGRVVFDGQDLTRSQGIRVRAGRHHPRARRSLGVRLAHRRGEPDAGVPRESSVARDAAPRSTTAYELFPRLSERRRQLAGSLSGGEQRMLTLARVLVHPPRLLVVDELSLGLAPIIIDEVYRNLAQLREKGVALIVVEQQVEHALELADRVVVLSRGEVSYDGPVAAGRGARHPTSCPTPPRCEG